MKIYTLDDLNKIYLETKAGSEYEDTPTFLLKLAEMEREEIHGDDSNVEQNYLDSFADPNEGDPGSEYDQMGDYYE